MIRPTARTCQLLLLAAMLQLGFVGWPGIASAAAGDRLGSLLLQWFDQLEATEPDADAIPDFIAESAFRFELTEREDPEGAEFRAWILGLRSLNPEVRFEVQSLETRVEAAERRGGEVHARFKLVRHTVDEDGIPHILAREHHWTIRDETGTRPTVTRIEERRSLSIPGTGPQIICF